MDLLLSHVRAAEKQKNQLDADAAHPIDRPTLRVFLTLTPSGIDTALQEMWVMTSPQIACYNPNSSPIFFEAGTSWPPSKNRSALPAFH